MAAPDSAREEEREEATLQHPVGHSAPARAACEDVTLPYEIRTEMEWVDFSNTANPLGAPPSVSDAVKGALAADALTFVPDRAGEHLAGILGRYYEYPADSFLPGTSVPAMIAMVAQAFMPCNVAIPSPAPAEYFLAVSNVGHVPIKAMNPYSQATAPPHLVETFGREFQGAVLANPSMPTARVLSEQTLRHYLDVCKWVIVDESHINLTLGGESFAHLTSQHDNLLVIRSLSEELGMPGVPLGYVVGNPRMIKSIRQFTDGSTIGMFHEVVARELPSLEEYFEATARYLDKEIPWMQCRLSLIPGIDVSPSESNYVMCGLKPGAGKMPRTAAQLEIMLQKAGFAIRDLTNTPGIDGDRFFLVSIRAHSENERFIKTLRDIMGSWD